MTSHAIAQALAGPKTGYAWIITKDHLGDNEEGTTGPRAATEEDLARLKAGEGNTFRMYDDDGELYYTGRLVVSGDLTYDDEEACFGPLDDYGTPNAGCTSIRWHGHPERDCG